MSVLSFRRTLVAAAAVLLTLGITAPASGAPARPPTDDDLRAALRGVVAAGASGVSLRVDDGRTTTRLAAGASRLDPPVPLRPGAKLRVGSITKSFIATVVLQLAGEHRLDLDDTVERWVPGLVPDGDHITLRHLLNHTSGLFDLLDDQAFLPGVLADPLREYTPRELIAIATAHPAEFAPGTDWAYSNTNYLALGLVVERVTQQPIRTVVNDRIVRPLGLHDTSLPARSPEIPGYHARGYLPPTLTGGGYVDFTRLSPTALGSAGALISSPDDLRTFYRALLSGHLLPPAQLAEMKRTVEVEPGYAYGLGLYTKVTPCGRIWGHDGNVPGFETTAWNDETGRRGFVLGIPTQPDAAISTAQDTATTVAACRMLGRPVP